MIRISITRAAFDAIASTLPLGSVGYENEINERGPYSIPSLGGGVMLGAAWIDRPVDTQGLRSLLPRPSQRSMEARPCSSQGSTFLLRLCDAPQRLCPDDPKRLTRSRRLKCRERDSKAGRDLGVRRGRL